MTDHDTELWAWVTETHEGKISLISVDHPLHGHLPLISHSKAAMDKMQSLAEAHGKALSQPVWLRRYTLAEEFGKLTAKLRMRN